MKVTPFKKYLREAEDQSPSKAGAAVKTGGSILKSAAKFAFVPPEVHTFQDFKGDIKDIGASFDQLAKRDKVKTRFKTQVREAASDEFQKYSEANLDPTSSKKRIDVIVADFQKVKQFFQTKAQDNAKVNKKGVSDFQIQISVAPFNQDFYYNDVVTLTKGKGASGGVNVQFIVKNDFTKKHIPSAKVSPKLTAELKREIETFPQHDYYMIDGNVEVFGKTTSAELVQSLEANYKKSPSVMAFIESFITSEEDAVKKHSQPANAPKQEQKPQPKPEVPNEKPKAPVPALPQGVLAKAKELGVDPSTVKKTGNKYTIGDKTFFASGYPAG